MLAMFEWSGLGIFWSYEAFMDMLKAFGMVGLLCAPFILKELLTRPPTRNKKEM